MFLQLEVLFISNILLTLYKSFDDRFFNSFHLIVIAVVCLRGHKNEFHIAGTLKKEQSEGSLFCKISDRIYIF